MWLNPCCNPFKTDEGSLFQKICPFDQTRLFTGLGVWIGRLFDFSSRITPFRLATYLTRTLPGKKGEQQYRLDSRRVFLSCLADYPTTWVDPLNLPMILGMGWERLEGNHPTNSPSPRSSYSMAYDEKRGLVVLFGGNTKDEITMLHDTWVYDGQDWTLKKSSYTPQSRRDAQMFYDPYSGITSFLAEYIVANLMKISRNIRIYGSGMVLSVFGQCQQTKNNNHPPIHCLG